MELLSDQEQKALKRYERATVALEGFRLLEFSALASNKLIGHIETSFSGKALTAQDHIFLRLLAERRARNYRKLTDVRETIELFSRMQQAAFQGIDFGGSV
jgi:hypothetical protein